MYSKYSWNTGALNKGTTNQMARALWSYHENIYISRRNDLLVVNIETMCKSKCATRLHVWSNLILVNISLLLIRNQDHNDISLLGSLSYWQNLQAVLLSNLLGLGAFIQTNDNVQSALLQVQCMSMTLAAITNNCNSLATDNAPVCILIIISFCHSNLSPHNVLVLCARHVPNL